MQYLLYDDDNRSRSRAFIYAADIAAMMSAMINASSARADDYRQHITYFTIFSASHYEKRKAYFHE